MSDMVKRKLVGADRYALPAFRDTAIERGEVVEVTAEHAAVLDADTFVNMLGEERRYFIAVTGDEGEEDEEDDAGSEVVGKNAARRSRAGKSATK